MSPLAPVGGPHTHGQMTVGQTMALVMTAIAPATAFGVYLFGWPALNLLLVTIATAVASEAFCLRIARKPIAPSLTDGSAVLSGWLLAMTLPPFAPWWIGAVGGAFAIIIGKQVFGGLGQNVFNPAMLARVALLISFPLQMTTWPNPQPLFSAGAPDFLSGLAITFSGMPNIDAVSSATVLGHVKTAFTQGHMLSQSLPHGFPFFKSLWGNTNGSLAETSAVLLVLGGLFLLARRIITWHIPVAMLGAVVVLSTLLHMANPERYADATFQLLSGGLIMGAFFMATDLVTSPSTPIGKLIFGAGCGAFTLIIRTWGGYPEGVAFAIVLMNSVTPLIDHFFRPRIYGRGRRGTPLEYPADATGTESLSNEDRP